MVGKLQPLVNNQMIVGPDGKPTEYFIRWAQQRQIDIGEAVNEERALEIVEEFVNDYELQAGSGIGITPDGKLTSNPTISADAQEILDQISDVHGSILYRDASAWAALAPGTAGQFLKTNGAGADPEWAASGGGSGTLVLIQTTTLSAVSSVDLEAFTGVNYSALKLILNVACSDSGANPTLRYKLNGSYKTANYRFTTFQRSSSSATNTVNNVSATLVVLTGTGATWGVGNTAGFSSCNEITVFNPANTSVQKQGTIVGNYIAPSGNSIRMDGSFTYDGADALTALEGIRIGVSTGTLTGTIQVYGMTDGT